MNKLIDPWTRGFDDWNADRTKKNPYSSGTIAWQQYELGYQEALQAEKDEADYNNELFRQGKI